ncbi:hypothetical protein AWENTII_001711 [Aspergillus wentii]|nr:hypothetical protein MW887_010235 [Aspergillus wentii]
MLGGSPERDSSPSAPTTTGEASMPIASTHQESNPESSPQGHAGGNDASRLESSELAPSSASAQSPEGASAAADSADPAKKHHFLLPIPSRSSLKADKQSTLDNAQEASHDDSENTLRGSKRSLLKGRRDRSRGSSRRSRRQNQDAPNGEEQKSAAASDLQDSKSEKKGKVSSKFFAFLSCCSSSNVDAEDPSVPPKRTMKRTSTSNRQSTPEKPDATAGDSSTESKEPNYYGEEKPNSTLTSDKPQSQIDEKSSPRGQGSQLDGAAGQPESDNIQASSQNNHVEEQPSKISQNAPVLPPVAASFTEEDSAHKLNEHAAGSSTTPAEEIPSDDIDGAVVKPPLPELDDREETKDSSHEEEATRFPVDLPPPPPIVPSGKQASAVHEEGPGWLLPPAVPHLKDRKCLVLDLDETLVHSSFKVLERADFTIPVEIEGQYHNIYVIKRPGVDQFMKRVGELYEVVVFTASVSKYGDPLLDQLDIHNVVHHRLFRDSCYNHQGNYVKDLSQVGRDLRETIIIDNSPTSYIFHPQHAIPISSWFSDAHDNELLDLIPVLEDLAGDQVKDVSLVLDISL